MVQKIEGQLRGPRQFPERPSGLDRRQRFLGVVLVIGYERRLGGEAVMLDPQDRPGRGVAVGDVKGSASVRIRSDAGMEE